jgi:phage tail-like protein
VPTLTDPAVSTCFTVALDGRELGTFTGCSGLGVELTLEANEEGGNQWFVHQLPGHLKYTNVRLTRPLDADSGQIAAWMSSMAASPMRSTARIAACRPDGSVVAEWTLTGVLPVRWTGPELSVDSSKACTETLELAHHGFLEA